MYQPKKVGPRGFTLVELLVVVATIGVLASLLLPVLGKAKIKANRAHCQSNLRQLGFAWSLYSADNNGLLPESYPVNNPYVWVQGDMSDPNQATNEGLIRKGKLYPYNQSLGIYRCPTDPGVTINKQRLRNVRSYSMNSFMGGRDRRLGPIPAWADHFVLFYSKESDIPRPSSLWVLLDEDERSINDGFFVSDPKGEVWIDFPAISESRHGYSYALNFADGHSEIWRHSDARTRRADHTQQLGNPDLVRLAGSTATRPSGN